MPFNLTKQSILITALLISATAAQAETTIPPTPTIPETYAAPSPNAGTTAAPTAVNPPTITVPTQSNAIAFAIEAGRIAGVLQACGVDVAVFANRANEAVNKLAVGMPDKVLAMENYQIALNKAQLKQTTSSPIPCNQAIKDFNNLPLMRDDYQQTVIAKLSPDMGPTNSPAQNNPAIANAQANAAANPPVSQVQLNSGYAQPLPAPGTPPPSGPSVIQQNAGYPAGGTTSITSAPPNSGNATPSPVPPSGMNQQNGTPLQQYVDNKTPPMATNPGTTNYPAPPPQNYAAQTQPNPAIYNQVTTK